MTPIKILSTLRGVNRFLRRCAGVVHVGANTGQERHRYEKYQLDVIWIEPIPEVYENLVRNISGLPRQEAHCALITDKDGETYTFNIASNGGASSSILDLSQHKLMWPEVDFVKKINLSSIRLDTFLTDRSLESKNYDALVIDTQGSELLVLNGAEKGLSKFRWIKVEVCDFEAYKNCCTISEISEFMTKQGFEEYARKKFKQKKSIGTYYDIVYRKI